VQLDHLMLLSGT